MVGRQPVQNAGDVNEPRKIGRNIAGKLELEPCRPVDRDHFFERLGQTIGGVPRMATDHIEQPDRMPNGDAVARREPSKQADAVEADQVERNGGGVKADEIGANCGVKGYVQRAAKCIENRAIDLRWTELGRERGHPAVLAFR